METTDGELTASVLEQIARLREAASTLMPLGYDTDWTMYRWLLGNHFDEALTLDNLRTHLYWRRYLKFDEATVELDADNILTTYLPIHAMGMTGVHPDRHFSIELLGLEDYAGFVDAVSPMDFITHRWRLAEIGWRLMKAGEAVTNTRHGHYAIVDMKGLVFSTKLFATITSIYPKMVGLVSTHYPESCFSIFVVNAPSAITTLMSMVRPFLPQRTKEKMMFITSNAELHEIIDPARLPSQYGGTLVDALGDPECKAIVRPPPTRAIPQSVYDSVNHGCPPVDTMAQLCVGAGKMGKFELLAVEGATTLTLFMLLAGDILLGIEMTDKNDNTEHCIPPTPFPSHPNVYRLEFDVSDGRKYRLIMDNRNAWLRSISLKYACESNVLCDAPTLAVNSS